MNFNLINWWSTIGLVLEIIGIIILFRHGLPSKIKQHAGGEVLDDANELHPDIHRHNEKVKAISYVGLVLVLVGVMLQIVGNNIQVLQFPN